MVEERVVELGHFSQRKKLVRFDIHIFQRVIVCVKQRVQRFFYRSGFQESLTSPHMVVVLGDKDQAYRHADGDQDGYYREDNAFGVQILYKRAAFAFIRVNPG